MEMQGYARKYIRDFSFRFEALVNWRRTELYPIFRWFRDKMKLFFLKSALIAFLIMLEKIPEMPLTMTIQRTHWHCPLVLRPHTPHSRGHIYCFFPFFSPLDDWKWVLLAFLVMAKKNPKMPNSGTILRLHWHSHLVLHPCTPKLRYHQNSFFDM